MCQDKKRKLLMCHVSFVKVHWFQFWHQNWVSLKYIKSPSLWLVEGLWFLRSQHIISTCSLCICGFPQTTAHCVCRLLYTWEIFFTSLITSDPYNLISWCRRGRNYYSHAADENTGARRTQHWEPFPSFLFIWSFVWKANWFSKLWQMCSQ